MAGARLGVEAVRRLWRMFRAALRPLPRPGVVLIEDFGRAGDASSLPDLCDCDAWGTDKEHRPETWTHSSDLRPDFAVRHPPCPRWRPKPSEVTAGRLKGGVGLTSADLREELWVFGCAANAATGMALPRPEMATVIRSPLPPSRPEYRRPAPTPVPGGGKKRHA